MRHRFVSAKADGLDSSLVRPGNWNDIHFHEEVSPPALTAQVNDYNPSATASLWRLSTSGGASRTITGIAGAVAGRAIIIVNLGPDNIVLAHQNADSSLSNRIISNTGVNITLAPDANAQLVYDNTSLRWRVVA